MSLAAGVSVAVGITALKLVLGNSIAGELPFAFFGLAITLIGFAGGARAAFVFTPILALVWWYHFLHQRDVLTAGGPLTLLVEGFAIGLVLSRMERTRDALRVARDRSQRFQRLTSALAVARTPEDIAQAMVTEGVAYLGAATGSVSRSKDRRQLELVALHGVREDVAAAYRTFSVDARLPAAEAFRSGEAIWVEDPELLLRKFPDVSPAASALAGAAVALPLKNSGGDVMGVAGFRFHDARSFSADDRTLMLTFASQCSQALERAELYAEEIAARRRLLQLDELSSSLSTALTRDDVARVVVERGVQAAAADVGTLYGLDHRDNSLFLVGDYGVSPELLEKIRRIDENSGNPALASMKTGEALWVENQDDYEALYPALARLPSTRRRAQAFWAVPLIAEGKAFGLIGMGFYEPRQFDKGERVFVETFARHCAEALRRSERLEAEHLALNLAGRLQSSLATTLRSIADAVIATDARGTVTFVNPVAEALIGWSETEAVGKRLRDVFRVVKGINREEVENPAERVLRTDAVIGLSDDTLLVSRDGTRTTPIEESGAPIRGQNDDVEGVVLVFRDVTAKKRQEGRLLFLSEAMRALGESLDYEQTLRHVARLAVPEIADWVAVDVVERESGMVKRLAVAHVDPAKVDLAREVDRRYPPDPRAPHGIYNVLRSGSSELYPVITDEMLKAGAKDEEHLRISRELNLRSAMVVPLVARGHTLGAMTFVAAESGQTYGGDDLHFAEDMARRCALAIDNARLFSGEREARHSADLANRAKDEFLAKVSHELRTPLNAIMGWAHMLASNALEQTKRERAVDTIQRNAVAMAQLIEDLLDVSRIISGKMRLEMQAVDLPQAIEAALESVRPAAEAKQIDVVCDFSSDEGSVRGDPVRIQQVVSNLLGNAVKFTGAGGRVEVSLKMQDGSALIRVSDTGKGIEPAFLPHVFDAFRQEESGHARSRSGLGLGLAIAKQLVELHGGRIEVTSEGLGRGSIFQVRLPLVQGVDLDQHKPSALRAISAFVPPEVLRGLRVLVVDDDDDARSLVRAVLEECGSDVQTAGSADEGLALFDQAQPDVLISDIGMPGRDGYDLIRDIRARPTSRGGGVPAAALTAFARAEDRSRVLDAGYSIHIAKPVEPAQLVAVVASLGRTATGRVAVI